MGQGGVGAKHDEKVGEAGHGQAHIGTRVIIAPALAQTALTPFNVHGPGDATSLKPGGQDQGIERMLLTVAGANPVWQHALNAVGDQIDLGVGQHAVPMVVAQHAFAVGRKHGHGFANQLGVAAHLMGDVGNQVLANFMVGRIQRQIRLRPVGVHFQVGVQTVCGGPKQLEAIPLRVMGQIFEGPFFSLVDL